MPPPRWERGWLIKWGMGSGLALGRAAECMAHGPHAWTTTICISPLANLSTFVRRVGGMIPRLAPTPLRSLGGAGGPFGGAGCADGTAVCDSSAARAGYRAVGGQVRPTTAATIGKVRGGCQSVARGIYGGLGRLVGGSPVIPSPHPPFPPLTRRSPAASVGEGGPIPRFPLSRECRRVAARPRPQRRRGEGADTWVPAFAGMTEGARE